MKSDTIMDVSNKNLYLSKIEKDSALQLSIDNKDQFKYDEEQSKILVEDDQQ